MRTSALSLVSRLHGKFHPILKVSGENQWSEQMGVLAGGPYMAAVASNDVGVELPSWRDFIAWMATHMTYGGTGITTNRINGGGTTPLNGGWGLNTVGLTTSISDTALFVPSAEARVAGAYTQQTTTYVNDTSQVIVTIQASATRAITEFALFDATTVAPQTTAASTVSTASIVSISVAATTGFTNGMYAQLDSEVVSITSSTAGFLTVARGQRGSTAATHILGTAIVGGEGSSNMYMKGDFATINLSSGDSIAFTAKSQFSPS